MDLPKGDWINHVGIEPNIKIELKIPDGQSYSREIDNQLDRAIQELTE
jgi:C-terminal processing protease CtpA/Prc